MADRRFEGPAMPLQNRVDPFGVLHADPARGRFTGNRGVIHDPDTRGLLKRRWTSKAWIICVCEFRGRRRDVMGRNAPSGKAGWTELFFLDEVTALAAGHRPCFFCRRERAQDYARRFGQAFGIARPKVAEMDARLHGERLASGGKAISLNQPDLQRLPDGAMVATGKEAWAVAGGMARQWSFAGYAAAVRLATLASSHPTLITPASTIAALTAGYRPAWHESASGLD